MDPCLLCVTTQCFIQLVWGDLWEGVAIIANQYSHMWRCYRVACHLTCLTPGLVHNIPLRWCLSSVTSSTLFTHESLPKWHMSTSVSLSAIVFFWYNADSTACIEKNRQLNSNLLSDISVWKEGVLPFHFPHSLACIHTSRPT